MLIVISAPSGTGKTTICKGLLFSIPTLKFSVSYTTRKPRSGEVEKGEYKFITRDKFQKMIENDMFIEWVQLFGDYYGTAKKTLEDAKNGNYDLLLDIDVVGGRKIKELFPDALLIFLTPPSIEELKKRLILRKTENKEALDKRLAKAKEENKQAKYYDYIVVNDKQEKAIEEIKNIILKKKGVLDIRNVV
ncbi:TPA: guanylate kinase [bacterium]|nr:guanylate kinase [bacterium]